MDLFLVYLWLKLDVFREALIGPLFLLIPVYMVGAWARFDEINRAQSTRQLIEDKSYVLFSKWHSRLGVWLVFAILGGTFLPSSKDTAILVGSHIAIESIKSPEGEKVGKLIRKKANEFLDEQLKEVTKK